MKPALTARYDELARRLARTLPPVRLVSDPLRLLAWGSDASFYRLTPKLMVVVEDEAELRQVLQHCAALGTPVTSARSGPTRRASTRP